VIHSCDLEVTFTSNIKAKNCIPAHSVESRPPFLDHVVAELAQTFSADTLVHLVGNEKPTEKWIFREAVRPYVTDEIYRRRKQAFAAPFRWKKGGPLHSKLLSLISRKNVERLGFADWKRCEGIVEKCYTDGDELLFRKVLWLAQIISLGLQFDIQPWTSNEGLVVHGGS
jgi:asparagine synthase (glutamine-hydrolysing)